MVLSFHKWSWMGLLHWLITGKWPDYNCGTSIQPTHLFMRWFRILASIGHWWVNRLGIPVPIATSKKRYRKKHIIPNEQDPFSLFDPFSRVVLINSTVGVSSGVSISWIRSKCWPRHLNNGLATACDPHGPPRAVFTNGRPSGGRTSAEFRAENATSRDGWQIRGGMTGVSVIMGEQQNHRSYLYWSWL